MYFGLKTFLFTALSVVIIQGIDGQCGTRARRAVHERGMSIVSGQQAHPREFPWQVSLRSYYDQQHFCGGSLIDKQWIVTAAHCFDRLSTAPYVWTIVIGITDQRKIKVTDKYTPSIIVTHRAYHQATKDNDIALIKLTKPVNLSGAETRAICLPDPDEDFIRSTCYVSGWGSTYQGSRGTQLLMKAQTPVIKNDECGNLYGWQMQPSIICTKLSQSRKGPCHGDSGGPLACYSDRVWKLAGVVSWGMHCDSAYRPPIYTRVSSYLDWIKRIQSYYP